MSTTSTATDPGHRHLFTQAEYLLMWERGVFARPPELIDSRLLEVRVDEWREQTRHGLTTLLPEGSYTVTTSPLPVGTDVPRPDVWVRRSDAAPVEQLTPSVPRFAPSDVALVVEVADETRDFALTRKSDLYAVAGYGEYWVVVPAGVFVHREPTEAGYRVRTLYRPGELVTVPYAPGSSLDVTGLITPGGSGSAARRP